MDIVPRIKEVLEAAPNEAQLDKFLNDVRDSLATSSEQFISFTILVTTALVTYHLVVYEGASGISLNSVRISDATLFRRVFLVVPAALLGAASCVGYRQREVYDCLTISRYSVLGKTEGENREGEKQGHSEFLRVTMQDLREESRMSPYILHGLPNITRVPSV